MIAFPERDDFDLGCHERGLLMELLLKGLYSGRRRAYAMCVRAKTSWRAVSVMGINSEQVTSGTLPARI